MIMGNYSTRWRHCFRGLSLDGGRADFSKKPHDASFNKDLSNEPTFGQIRLAGQYLERDTLSKETRKTIASKIKCRTKNPIKIFNFKIQFLNLNTKLG
jgi:hypothetical protein